MRCSDSGDSVGASRVDAESTFSLAQAFTPGKRAIKAGESPFQGLLAAWRKAKEVTADKASGRGLDNDPSAPATPGVNAWAREK
jgi:hypothetical protein